MRLAVAMLTTFFYWATMASPSSQPGPGNVNLEDASSDAAAIKALQDTLTRSRINLSGPRYTTGFLCAHFSSELCSRLTDAFCRTANFGNPANHSVNVIGATYTADGKYVSVYCL